MSAGGGVDVTVANGGGGCGGAIACASACCCGGGCGCGCCSWCCCGCGCGFGCCCSCGCGCGFGCCCRFGCGCSCSCCCVDGIGSTAAAAPTVAPAANAGAAGTGAGTSPLPITCPCLTGADSSDQPEVLLLCTMRTRKRYVVSAMRCFLRTTDDLMVFCCGTHSPSFSWIWSSYHPVSGSRHPCVFCALGSSVTNLRMTDDSVASVPCEGSKSVTSGTAGSSNVGLSGWRGQMR
mmetsp:Transcript_24138/g.60130  ORF Transcript_24138/g.60130 Transcript_24138/m.60130 type:complete len:235 (+) Transcript_24138:110-814(+)